MAFRHLDKAGLCWPCDGGFFSADKVCFCLTDGFLSRADEAAAAGAGFLSGKGIALPALSLFTGDPLPTLSFSGTLSLGEFVISRMVSLTAFLRAFRVGASPFSPPPPQEVTMFLGR